MSRFRCPACGAGDFRATTTRWVCGACGEGYACTAGIPRLYREERVGAHDRKLRDTFYDGVFGRFYAFMMPFIVMPVRPLAISWPHWLAFGGALMAIVALVAWTLGLLVAGAFVAALPFLLVLAGVGLFLNSNRYLFHLLVLALPTWISVNNRPYAAREGFPAVHARVQKPLKSAGRRLQVLDVSTGSCNSLYRHGWMDLDADYTGVDLSETMLRKGGELMSGYGVPVDLVLGDAMALPFQSDSFDVVLSYGAVNGLSDPVAAIAEMARVAKPGGVILFLDEQLYDRATAVERAYFHRVLSSHNVIHHCPVDRMPPELEDVVVSQVYQFYYICTARKRVA